MKNGSNLPARATVRAALLLQLNRIVPELPEKKTELEVVRELQAVVNVGLVGLEVSPKAGTKITNANRDRTKRSAGEFLLEIMRWGSEFINAISFPHLFWLGTVFPLIRIGRLRLNIRSLVVSEISEDLEKRGVWVRFIGAGGLSL